MLFRTSPRHPPPTVRRHQVYARALLHQTDEDFAVCGPLALNGSASYAVSVRRPAASLPRFLPTVGHPSAVAVRFASCAQLTKRTSTSKTVPMLGAPHRRARLLPVPSPPVRRWIEAGGLRLMRGPMASSVSAGSHAEARVARAGRPDRVTPRCARCWSGPGGTRSSHARRCPAISLAPGPAGGVVSASRSGWP